MTITHGDFDYIGNAFYLVDNIKIEKVILNCGEVNDLENDLIKILTKNQIKYYTCIKELNINDNKLSFLQTGKYDNESVGIKNKYGHPNKETLENLKGYIIYQTNLIGIIKLIINKNKVSFENYGP